MAGFNWLDFTLVGLMGVSGLVGLVRGLVRELFSLFAWGVSIWVGLQFGADLATYLEETITQSTARAVAAFTILFLVTLMLAGVVGILIARLIENTGLVAVDRGAGLLFGIARGALVIVVLVFLARETPFPRDSWWQESKLIPWFQSLALALSRQIPPDFVNRLGSRVTSR